MTEGPNGHDPNGNQIDEGPIEPTLVDLLADLAEEFSDVEERPVPGGIEYVTHERAFVRLTGATAHFRLRPEVAAAAIRTPAAAASPLGPDWVTFSPGPLDQYALDRAQAWFELGHRLAAEVPGRAKRH